MTSSASGSPPKSAPAWILALDASTPRTAIALGTISRSPDRAQLVAAFEAEDRANQASQWLLSEIRELLTDAGIGPSDLAGIACGCGPGTFTGTRVAIATCQGLAFGLGLPSYPLSTLAALAGEGTPGEPVLALLDARRGEVYAGHYDLNTNDQGLVLIRQRAEDRCAPLAEILGSTGDVRAIGPGVAPYRDLLPATAEPSPGIGAKGLWRAAVSTVLQGTSVHPRALAANYLRQSYAELGIHRPKRPMIRSPFAD